MTRPALSVFIITRNAERTLEPCLQSVRWADEIVVLDSLSTDRTLRIAGLYTQKIHTRPFTDFADQKNAAMALCTGPWLLSLDADEIVPAELRAEIESVLESPAAADAYRVPRQSVMFGKVIRFSGTQDDRPVRLFRKGSAAFEQPIHEMLRVKSPVGDLENRLMHYTYACVADYFTRFRSYTSAEADFLLQKNHRPLLADFLLRPFGLFLKLYFVKQGFRDGWEGLFFCFFSGAYVFVKHAKYRKLLAIRSRGVASL